MSGGFAFLIPSKEYTHVIDEPNILKKALMYFKYISVKCYDVLDPKSGNRMGAVLSMPLLPESIKGKALKRCIRWITEHVPDVVNAIYVADDFPALSSGINVLFREGLLRWASGLYVMSAILAMKASSWQQQEIAILGADEREGNMMAKYLADKANYLTLAGRNRYALDELAEYLLRNYGLAASIYAYEDLNGLYYDMIISAASDLIGACAVNANIVLCRPSQRALFDKSCIVMEGGYIDSADLLTTSADLSPLETLYMIELIAWQQRWAGFEGVYGDCSVGGFQNLMDNIHGKLKITGYICEDQIFSYNYIRKKLFQT